MCQKQVKHHYYLAFLVSKTPTHLGLPKELKSELLPHDEILGSYLIHASSCRKKFSEYTIKIKKQATK